MGAREEQVLQTAMIMDQPLMDTFISIRNKPRAYWDKYNTTDLSKIAYSLKTLYFDVSAAYSFFLPGTKESNFLATHSSYHSIRHNTGGL